MYILLHNTSFKKGIEPPQLAQLIPVRSANVFQGRVRGLYQLIIDSVMMIFFLNNEFFAINTVLQA